MNVLDIFRIGNRNVSHNRILFCRQFTAYKNTLVARLFEQGD